MNRHLYVFSLITILCMTAWNAGAQVGINTTNPHASAALDIQSSTKGLLIPRLDSAARVGMTGMANSLLVFDTTKNLYFYYQDGQWYALNAWSSRVTESGGNTDTITTTNSRVGIGYSNPTKALQVNGDIEASKTIAAGISVSAPKLYGEGAVPVGAIIMWSGNPDALPPGWALCDGVDGRPDLKGRFIAGYDPADPDYNAPNKTGPAFSDADGASNGTNTQDAKQVRLTGQQSGVAAHNHTAVDQGHTHKFNDVYQNDKTVGKNSGGGENAGSDSETTTPNVTEAGKANIVVNNSIQQNAVDLIENRPPYYVLAYIIKVAY